MQGKDLRMDRRKRAASITAAIVTALAIVPAAQASTVTPRVVTPTTVTPQLVTPPSNSSTVAQPAPVPAPARVEVPTAAPQYAPASSSSPASLPSATPRSAPSRSGGPSGSVPERDVPGSNVPSNDYDPPFPEGLPDHWEDSCVLSCKQEWYDWFQSRARVVYVESTAGTVDRLRVGGRVADEPEEKVAARLLADEVDAIEREIHDLGGTAGEPDEPEEPTPVAVDTGWGSQPSAPASHGGPAPSASSSPVPVPDAISGAGEIVTNDLGSWDLSGPFEVTNDFVGAVAAFMGWDDFAPKKEN